MSGIDIEKLTREETRWRILRLLDSGRPGALSETILFRGLTDINLPVTPKEVRRQLDYLEERELVTISGRESPTWSAELTRIGIDVVEYTVPCDAGIARPKQWD